jgi:predicted amidohydrolase YtcJ
MGAVMGLDHITGSRKLGQRAALSVLDRDLTAMTVDQIFTARCLLTLMNGHVRHHARSVA